MLVRRDEEQHAVVLVLLAEFPLAEQGVGVGFDLVAAEIAHRGDDKLDRRFGFEIGELALKARNRGRREHMRVVDDAPGQRRERRRRERRGEGQPREQSNGGPAQNFTFGAACASGAAVNADHRLGTGIERGGPDHAGERAQLRVISLHRADIVPPRHRDAVFGALKLRLQRQEIGVRLEVGIVLASPPAAATTRPSARSARLATP